MAETVKPKHLRPPLPNGDPYASSGGGEAVVELPAGFDASLYYIGRIRTPWQRREDCPKNARSRMRFARSNLIRAGPRGFRSRDRQPCHPALLDGPGAARPRGAIASPLCRAKRHLCVALTGAAQSHRAVSGAAYAHRWQQLSVVGIDCLDNTPLLDIKPYFASTDSVPDAHVGWHANARGEPLKQRRHDAERIMPIKITPS